MDRAIYSAGDDIVIMQGACTIYAAGVASGNAVTMLDAIRLSALALGHARSPEIVGLVGAASAYPHRTSLVESGIAGVIAAVHRERREEWMDALAVTARKLLDQLGRHDGGTVKPADERCLKTACHDGWR